MKAPTEFRVMVSPLTKTAYAGPVRNMGGSTFEKAGARHDVTNDVFGAIIEIVGLNNTHVLSIGGVPQYEIEVRDVRPIALNTTTGAQGDEV